MIWNVHGAEVIDLFRRWMPHIKTVVWLKVPVFGMWLCVTFVVEQLNLHRGKEGE